MADMVARGMVLQAMPYNPAILSKLGRPPRVLVIGESILFDYNFQAKLQALVPGAQVELRAYGGSQSAMGMLMAASDVQAKVTTGNLLPKSQIPYWNQSNCTVTQVLSPSSGRSTYQVSLNGVAFQAIYTSGALAATVPTGAPNLCFSVEIEPGTTIQTFRITIQNATRSNGVISQVDFLASNMSNRANLPARYIVPITSASGVGYAAGDQITVTINPGADDSPAWPSGTIYISNPMLNVGNLPAPYVQTTGTAQTPGSAAWSPVNPGTNRRLFDLAVVQFGRNDASSLITQNISALDHERILSGIVSGISQYAARVMIVTPPPLANSSTPTAWAPSDYYQTNGLWAAALRVAYKHGCYLYDAWTDFQKQTASGTYTVSQIMRDQYHPTNAQMNSPGMALFINAIASVLNGTKDTPVRPLGNGPQARIGGDVISGNWTWKILTAGMSPTSDPYGILVGHQKEPNIGAYMSNTAGDTLQFTVTGSVIGLIVVNDINTSGQMTVSVDGVQVATINTNNLNENMFPLGYIVATGLAETSHTVQVQTVSGTVYVQACVAI